VRPAAPAPDVQYNVALKTVRVRAKWQEYELAREAAEPPVPGTVAAFLKQLEQMIDIAERASADSPGKRTLPHFTGYTSRSRMAPIAPAYLSGGADGRQ
jgi:hypothetical protein